MRNSTQLKKAFYGLSILLFFWVIAMPAATAQANVWDGQNSSWNTASNWSAGVVPDASTDVIISGSAKKMPVINYNGMAVCRNLTVENGASIFVSNDKGMAIYGDVMIQPNGGFTNNGSSIEIAGNWVNDGTFEESIYIRGNVERSQSGVKPKITFSGTGKTIGGASPAIFNNLVISGSITLSKDVEVAQITSGQVKSEPSLSVSGTLDPSSYLVSFQTGTGVSPSFTLEGGATILVKASTLVNGTSYYANYNIGPTTMNTNSTVNYAGDNQVIESSLVYRILRVSGSGTKTLKGNTAVYGAQGTQLAIDAGILDLESFTLDREAGPGGLLTIASGATLRIGGANNFPSNYATRTLDANSTVEYYGDNQTVQHTTYGHLTLSGAGIKAMPTAAMTVAGNLTSAGTASFTAGAAINVAGNVAIGAGTTFTGGAHTHSIAGNWVNNGTFIHGGGTILFNSGTNTSITGTTVFNGLTVSKTNQANYVSLNNEVTATTLNMTNGELRTGANRVVVLGDRTGSGWVVGTFTRRHTFAPGVAYAFNGPQARLHFTGGTGVTEASMTSGTGAPTGFLSGKSVNRMYQISGILGSYANAGVQLQYEESELNGCIEDGLKLYRAPAATGIWRTTSRNGLDAAQNWASMDGFSDVIGYWTLTDNPSTYRWKGNTSTAWETASNWEVTTDDETTGGFTPPISSDLVVLGELAPVSQPSINTAVVIRNLTFAGGNQIQLSIASGSLATQENVAAAGAGAGVQHLLQTNGNSLTVGQNLILSDGSTGNSLWLASTSGSIAVSGNINHPVGAGISLGSGSLAIGGNYNYAAGAEFAAGTGTVFYNGAGAQPVAVVQYYNLALQGTGVKTFGAGTTGIAGAYTISGSATADMLTNSSVLNFNGSGAQVIPAQAYYSILVTGGGAKTLAGNATVASELRLTNGTVATGTSKFILGNAATIIEDESNYVTGLVATERSVGTEPEAFGGIGMMIDADVSPGLVTVIRETGATVGMDGYSAMRNFSILPTGTNQNLNATVTLSYFMHELNGIPESRLSVYNSTDNVLWYMHPEEATMRSSVRKTVTVSGVNGLSRLALGEIEAGISPLPVDLGYFKAEKKGHDAVLTWTTTNEDENKGFNVEVSLDGEVYRKIGFVSKGTGTSRVAILYTFTDKEPGKNGTRYYRLRQVDLDGRTSYYGPRVLTFEKEKGFTASAYPNPFQNRVNLSIQAGAGGAAKIRMFDTAGKVVLERTAKVEAGTNTLTLDLAGTPIPKGMYVITVETEGQLQRLKLMKD